MADRMMTRRLDVAVAPRRTFLAFCCALSVSGTLHAEDLPDPTRPPAGIFVIGGGTGGGTGAGAEAGREVTENRSTGLHTIIISETRRAAIIDGQTVELGGEHGGAKLVEVNEGSVVMQRAQGKQVLTLFPDVKITRKETPAIESAEKESPNTESPNIEPQVKQPPSTSKRQSRKHKTGPAAHKEKLLSGHPKEEK